MKCKLYCNPSTKRIKKEELKVEKILQDNNLVFQRETHISYDCINDPDKKYARVDFLLETKEDRRIIEVCEHQHESYPASCEASRVMQIMEACHKGGNHRKTLWIFYNPHAFKVDGVTTRVPTKKRLATLLDVVLHYKPTLDTEVLHMYYDVENGQLKIKSDFSSTFHSFLSQRSIT